VLGKRVVRVRRAELRIIRKKAKLWLRGKTVGLNHRKNNLKRDGGLIRSSMTG